MSLTYMAEKPLTLFGGSKGWHSDDWTDSDDRVRGGKSISYLDCTDKTGTFRGILDIKTLEGAGFASQRTTQEDAEWDLSRYAGIELCITKGDKKRYTFNLKDELLSPDPDTGREQASVTYECDFELPPQTQPGDTHDKTVFIPWSSFNATYRGRPKKDSKPINLKKIRRCSIMMRSFFGTQEGNFSLEIRSICALVEVPKHASLQKARQDTGALEKGRGQAEIANQGRVAGIRCCFRRKWGVYFLSAAVSTFAVYHLIHRYWHACD